jgi:hypothetical protein
VPSGGLGFADAKVGEFWSRSLRLHIWIAVTAAAIALAFSAISALSPPASPIGVDVVRVTVESAMAMAEV